MVESVISFHVYILSLLYSPVKYDWWSCARWVFACLMTLIVWWKTRRLFWIFHYVILLCNKGHASSYFLSFNQVVLSSHEVSCAGLSHSGTKPSFDRCSPARPGTARQAQAIKQALAFIQIYLIEHLSAATFIRQSSFLQLLTLNKARVGCIIKLIDAETAPA